MLNVFVGVASFSPIPGWSSELPSGHPNGKPGFPSGKLHIAIKKGPFIDHLPHGFLVFRSYVKLQKVHSH